MPGGRKVPFSNKAKKEQLKAKRARKQQFEKRESRINVPFLKRGSDEEEDEEGVDFKSRKLNFQPSTSKKGKDVNRYALQFYKETKEELEKRKEDARKTLVPVKDEDTEIKHEYYFPCELDFPKRPPWNFNMSREQLDAREHKYFTEYVKRVEDEFGAQNLSYFELNLETWRQLWRVLEMSDIVLIIVDIRFPALMFPPSVYKFVVEESKKDMILVLNKIDLVPADVVVAWKHYFLKHYPTLKIVTFTSFPTYNLRNVADENKTGLLVRRRKGKLRMAAEGAQRLYEACKEITQNQVDLTSWSEKINEEMNSTYDDEDEVERNVITQALDTGFEEHERYKGGILTIGCIGQPNVGKSSLMNAIMGKKVVSVSRTPGHTKHFQTIFLTKNVRLCDCPGLVFPSKIPRNLQILIGAYPIAQVREPYSAVKFLVERLDLPKLLGIQHPENDDTWSAMDVCDGWAKKRGFFTAKAARLDSYRAANNILRMSLEGRICLSFKPPEYFSNQDHWKKHPDVSEIVWIQAKEKTENLPEEEDVPYSSEEDDKEAEKSENSESEEEDDDDDEEDEIMTQPKNKFALLSAED